ncbi:MAG: c-type cytochrome [Hyphomicrobiales bacterium]|nr:MAG: c-type cytochrome [Hyphomicrobiales bacterium]
MSFFPRILTKAAAAILLATPLLLTSLPTSAQSETAPEASGDFMGYPITEFMDVTLLEGADIDKGRDVYNRVGVCLSCHGWNGDGMGKNPRSEGDAAKLRESQLDTQTLIDIISCGIPGTPMPYHNNQAYKKPEICYGMTAADFEPADMPRKGKSIRPADMINLVAYLQTHVQGAGETTLAQCQDYYGASADKVCMGLE